MTDRPGASETPPMPSETPRTDALIKQHSEEHLYLESRDEWRTADAVRQARDLLDHARQLERELATAHREREEAERRAEAAEKDAARYRFLRERMTVPKAMQSFIAHMNWHPNTFDKGIDEAIDTALSSQG